MAREDSIMARLKTHIVVAWSQPGGSTHVLTGPKGEGFTTYCSRVVDGSRIAWHGISGRECKACDRAYQANPARHPFSIARPE